VFVKYFENVKKTIDMESTFTKNNKRPVDIVTFINTEYFLTGHLIVPKRKADTVKSLCNMRNFVKPVLRAAWVRKPVPVSQDKINQTGSLHLMDVV